MQQIEYLPSGMVFRRSNNYGDDYQKLEFCGKERIDMHNYSVYDSQARFQYAKIPRFLSIDPLCEKYYDVSPYSYCSGDPVNRIDPDGRDWYETFGFDAIKKKIVWTDYNIQD